MTTLLEKNIQLEKLLLEAVEYLCAEDPGQGDYCLCGAYVGRGDKHNKNCLYVKIKKALRNR